MELSDHEDKYKWGRGFQMRFRQNSIGHKFIQISKHGSQVY